MIWPPDPEPAKRRLQALEIDDIAATTSGVFGVDWPDPAHLWPKLAVEDEGQRVDAANTDAQCHIDHKRQVHDTEACGPSADPGRQRCNSG